ncbi:hypothetical protein ScPMuIL_008470 [Solemya velum]
MIGISPGASFKGDRSKYFQGAERAVFLMPKMCNDSPSPNYYNIDSTIGKTEGDVLRHFKEPVKTGVDILGNPRHQNARYPDPKSSGLLVMTTPGPGSYDISKNISKNHSPRTTFGRADDYPVDTNRSRIAQSHSMLSIASDPPQKEWLSLTSRSEPPKKFSRRDDTLPVPRSTPRSMKHVTIVQH